MAYSLSPWLKPRFFITGTNRPLAGGLMYTYKAGTTDPATTYSDDAGTPNTNPIQLDSDGQCDLFLDDSVSYRIILKNSAGVTQFDKDRIASLGSTQVQSFNSIAALRLRSGTTIANAAKTLGYYAAGDGGGNSFYWDSTSTATDNAGTVIKPTAVSGAGRWLAVNTTTFTAEQFGAYGDGVQDDTAAINKAIAVLSASGGGVLNFDGIYRLTENATGTTQTRFTISSDNVTLVFLSKAKFLVKSDSATTVIFALAGISYFKLVGTLRVESDASTPYTTTGAYGAKALVILNKTGETCENIEIDAVHITRGTGGVFIQNAAASSNRVQKVRIGKITTVDATYGYNPQNNGDYVQIGLIETYGAYRSFFAYGVKHQKAIIRAIDQYSGGTPINVTEYSVAEGGSGVHSSHMDLDLEIDGGAPSVSATIRHIGDGGAAQVISNIYIRCKANALPANAITLQNYDTSGAAASSTPFVATMKNIVFENMNTDTGYATAISYSPCSWTTKPRVFWHGPGGMSAANFQSVTIGNVVDLWQAPYLGLNCKDPVVMNNQVAMQARDTAGAALNMLSVDSSNNRQYGSSTTSATYSAMYGGANGVYINTNGSSRVQFTDSFFRPQVDNTYSNGTASQRWSVIYAGTGTINTSDERLKQQISDDLAPELKAWAKVNFCKYKFNDAVEIKGDGARWHIGVIAQQVKEAFESEGLDPFAYGILCYDEWDAEEEVLDDNGTVINNKREAGNRYGIRYEEALILECAYLRSKIK